MNLELPFGLHQMQRRPYRRLYEWSQPSPLKGMAVPTERTLRGLMGGQACGHHDSVDPGEPGTPRM